MIGKALCFTLLIATSLQAEDAEALFVRRVWPLFQEKCLACHGNDEKKIKGGLDMRTLASTLKGGDSEQATLVPGKPDESPLYLASTRSHDDWEAMPPKENDKLTSEQLGWIKTWIAGGAPWPEEAKRTRIANASADKWSAEDGIIVKSVGALSPDWASRRYKSEDLWAYQPIQKPEVRGGKEDKNPIDELIAMRLPKDVQPAPAVDARTFIRRATYDLTGLPPTPEEVEAFVQSSATSPASSIKALIDRLLDSPHYGERWARHWLDVVRYADSSGFANDFERGNAWRYRDYVVRSLNNDKPYNQFVIEQIAGDELLEANQEPGTKNQEPLIATGLLRMGPWELTGMEVAKVARQRFLDDVTNSVGETFLAHSLQCARCHDHKFDPIPTHDYYAFQACFGTTQLAEREAAFLKEENTRGFEEKKYLDQRRAEFLGTLKRLDDKLLQSAQQWYAEKKMNPAAWNQAVKKAHTLLANGAKPKSGREFSSLFESARGVLQKQGVPEGQYPPKQVGFTTEEFGLERIARKGLERLKWEYDRYQPVALAVYNGRTVDMKAVLAPLRMPQDRMTNGELEQTAILGGGDPFSPTTPVKPAALSAVSELASADYQFNADIEGRRTQLAKWITDPKNPLTARVMMNRVWLWHFGQPIAGNPNNFGSTGKKPTHPELLDWLAATFMEKGWSLKAMHRIIMTSEAYRRSAQGAESKATREDLEKSYAVFKPRRLSAEEMRDSMLAISGELNPILGGIPVRPEINLEAALQPRQVMGTFATAWQPNPLPEQRHRRSLYVLKIRGLRDPFMEVFNEPGPDFSCEARDASNVTPQVFSLFNGQPTYDRALAFAARVRRELAKAGPQAQINHVYALTLGRTPTADESDLMLAHWRAMTLKHQALKMEPTKRPLSVVREAVEENTGEKFKFTEPLYAYQDFKRDIDPSAMDAETRGLAEVCLVLFNSNEFTYLY